MDSIRFQHVGRTVLWNLTRSARDSEICMVLRGEEESKKKTMSTSREMLKVSDMCQVQILGVCRLDQTFVLLRRWDIGVTFFA